ncbi:hypothetical protein K437DRAFT_272672 [Tilletiaria anomala UBC 951]|uniref:Uncharacterized protein n=1 Tax=Tilletiaria anomala (strain ATCC 24038 / CBS 436.72 / UBC 951) TaxID=1037660 RepID=A0A066WDV0_TILAU|nr:uncharacterized protein K437DRAFT_272672 [Tilletiaria anomala UBC 951]KDN52132.1 hypothetical protein K437DRAFT_272672 [Tilletiaria anomala UBC 951]
MQLSQITYTLLLAGAVWAQSAGISINTPTGSLIVGIPVQITFSGGQSPYTLLVNDYTGGQSNGLLDTIQSIQSSPYTFVPTSGEVGKQLQFDLRDANGAQAQSGATSAKVVASNSSSGSSSSSSSSTSASSSTASSSTASSSTKPSSSASSSSKPNSAASLRGAAGAVAGVVGMAAAALF